MENKPFLYSNVMEQWLENALDYGITEAEFWNMTIGELDRAIRSKQRVYKVEAQERATFDYALANLIGKSIARLYSSTATLPDISEVYPTLFDSEELKQKKQELQAELSALRFKQFANSFNTRFNQGGAKE